MKISSIGIKEAFKTFNTVQKLAPAANGLGGSISVGLNYGSLLGKDMMPLISTITGGGEIRSEMVQILESKTFDQMKGVIKLNAGYTNIIRDVRAAFTISNGRVFVKPFDTRLGNIKMNVAGDQGLDQTINYIVKTEIPRSDLGESVNALLGTLSAQAALLGVSFVPSDIIKLSLKVGGTFTKPVITPILGGSESSGSPAASAAAVAETIKAQVSDKVNETAREQADKLLKEAEEKANLIRAEAATAAESIRKEADLQGQKLIKEAESKGTIAVIAARKGAEALKKEAEKRAVQLVTEANSKADTIIAEARSRADELLK
jgi:vacuolar-type H+-ATPase subunit H